MAAVFGGHFVFVRSVGCFDCFRHDADAMFAFEPFKLNTAFGEGEKSIVLAFADIVTWMNGCAALSDKNVTGFYEFAGKFLGA